ARGAGGAAADAARGGGDGALVRARLGGGQTVSGDKAGAYRFGLAHRDRALAADDFAHVAFFPAFEQVACFRRGGQGDFGVCGVGLSTRSRLFEEAVAFFEPRRVGGNRAFAFFDV